MPGGLKFVDFIDIFDVHYFNVVFGIESLFGGGSFNNFLLLRFLVLYQSFAFRPYIYYRYLLCQTHLTHLSKTYFPLLWLAGHRPACRQDRADLTVLWCSWIWRFYDNRLYHLDNLILPFLSWKSGLLLKSTFLLWNCSKSCGVWTGLLVNLYWGIMGWAPESYQFYVRCRWFEGF